MKNENFEISTENAFKAMGRFLEALIGLLGIFIFKNLKNPIASYILMGIFAVAFIHGAITFYIMYRKSKIKKRK